MPINSLAVLVAFIGNIFLSLFTLLKNPKSTTNRLFFLFTLSISIYLLFNYFITYQTTDSAAFFWVKMVMSIALFINLFFYLLSSTFPQQKITLAPLFFWFSISSTFLMIPLVQLGLVFQNAKSSGEAGSPGIAMPLFLLHTIVFLGMGFIGLVKKLRKSSGVEKNQVQLFLLGAILMFILILVTNLLFVLVLKTAAFINLLPIYTLIFVGFISYAIVRHKFLDINLLVTRTVSFALLTGLFGLLYSLLFAVLSSVFTNSTLQIKTIAVSTVLALIMAFSFQPLRRALEKISDKFFYKNKYDTNKLLYELALIMASTLRLEELALQVIKQILTQMRINSGGFILVDNGDLYRIFKEGFNKEFNIDKNQLKTLYKYETFIFDEISEGETKEVMRQLNLRIVIPLKTQSEEIGIFILGDKLSGDIYTSEDIRVLQTLAPEIAIAVQNAKAFEEIKKFNITLQQEVDKSTKGLQVANQKLKELDLLKDDFVSVASHELRTPMTAIRSYAWMALHKSDIPLSQKLERYLYRTLVSTERLINLVNDMLNVSRIESGKIEINPKPFDIIALVKDVAEEVTAKAEEKKLTISIMEHVLPQVFADIDKVHQVLLNLVGNSLKFCYPGGNIIIDFFVSEDTIEISIKDNGAGISKEDIAKLFHKFSRLDASYTSVGTSGGTGLGLYISKNLIQLMHGEIKASSEGTNKGTTVTFSLPIATKELVGSGEKYHIKPEDGEAKMLEPVAI